MFDDIKEYVQQAAVYGLSNYGIPISFVTSFFVNRFITKTPEESYKQSGLIAASVAGVAAIDYTLRNKEYVSTYAITYGTMTISYIYPLARSKFLATPIINRDSTFSQVISIAGAPFISVCSGLGVGIIAHYRYVPHSISPLGTSVINYNIHGLTAAIVSGIFSVTDEVMIHYNITDKHYLSFFAVSQGISRYYLSQQAYTLAISIGVASISAPYEVEILEALLPIKSTKQSYNLLLEMSGGDSKKVNRILEDGLVITGNIEMSYGILYMQMLEMMNQWFVLFGEACENLETVPRFIEFAKKNMLFDFIRIVIHGLPLIPIEDSILWITKKHFKDQLLNRTIYQPSTFILVSKSNNTAEMYSNDVSNIISTHWMIYQEITKSIPSIVKLTSFGNKVVIIPAIVVVDYVCTAGLNALQEWLQQLNEAKDIAANKIGVIEKHDREYANSLVQTGAISRIRSQWQDAINDVDKLALDNELVSDISNLLYNAYWEVGLWGAVPIVVVKFATNGRDGIFTAVMAIKNSVGTILIKSKKKQQLNQAEISINRLLGLFSSINNQYDISQNVKILYNNENVLRVNNLTYARGNPEGNITVTVPSISFTIGKKYAVTGDNGSGKSSFLLLLNLLLRSINDDSFLNVSGVVSYPIGKMSVITQKEYCPVHTDMFSWLVYPKDSQQFSAEEKQDYQSKIVSLLDKLNFSPKNSAIVAEEFHTVKNNWCGELSGGQVKKIQLMQQVFIPDECPKVLLMDEVMGPLDPTSKTIVHQMIMTHCKDSLIISVHHYDSDVSCVPTKSMYDYNLHFEDGTAIEKPLCSEDDLI